MEVNPGLGEGFGTAVTEGANWGLGVGDAEKVVLVVMGAVDSMKGSVGYFDSWLEGGSIYHVW